MKKYIILIILFFDVVASNAQRNYVHEFGLGLGSVELNPYLDHYSQRSEHKWTFNSIFKQNSYSNVNVDLSKISKKRTFTTPKLYYTNKATLRSSFRAAFQYAKERGEIVSEFNNEFDEPGMFHFEQKLFATTLGYSYTFLNHKKLSLYVASDLDIMYKKINENKIEYYGGDCFIVIRVNEQAVLKRTDINFRVNQILGIKFSVLPRLNVSYELSGKVVGMDIHLLPVNRLSLDYMF